MRRPGAVPGVLIWPIPSGIASDGAASATEVATVVPPASTGAAPIDASKGGGDIATSDAVGVADEGGSALFEASAGTTADSVGRGGAVYGPASTASFCA